MRAYAWLAGKLGIAEAETILDVATPLVVLAYMRGLRSDRFRAAFQRLAEKRPSVALRVLSQVRRARDLSPPDIAPLLELPERRQRERASLWLASRRVR